MVKRREESGTSQKDEGSDQKKKKIGAKVKGGREAGAAQEKKKKMAKRVPRGKRAFLTQVTL